MFSFIYKINSKEKPLQMLKLENETNTMELKNLLSSIEALRAMTPQLRYMVKVLRMGYSMTPHQRQLGVRMLVASFRPQRLLP